MASDPMDVDWQSSDNLQRQLGEMQKHRKGLEEILDAIVKQAKTAGVTGTDKWRVMLTDDNQKEKFITWIGEQLRAGQQIEGDPDALTKLQAWDETMRQIALQVGITRGYMETPGDFAGRIQTEVHKKINESEVRKQNIERLNELLTAHQELIATKDAEILELNDKREEIETLKTQMKEETVRDIELQVRESIVKGKLLDKAGQEKLLDKLTSEMKLKVAEGEHENAVTLLRTVFQVEMDAQRAKDQQAQTAKDLEEAKQKLAKATQSGKTKNETIDKLKEQVSKLTIQKGVADATKSRDLQLIDQDHEMKGLRSELERLKKEEREGGHVMGLLKDRLDQSAKKTPAGKNSNANKSKNLLSAKKTTRATRKKMPELTGNQMTIVAVVGAGLMGLGSVASGMMAMLR
jgi:hypothetical protein